MLMPRAGQKQKTKKQNLTISNLELYITISNLELYIAVFQVTARQAYDSERVKLDGNFLATSVTPLPINDLFSRNKS